MTDRFAAKYYRGTQQIRIGTNVYDHLASVMQSFKVSPLIVSAPSEIATIDLNYWPYMCPCRLCDAVRALLDRGSS